MAERITNHPLAALQRLRQQYRRDLITPLVAEYEAPSALERRFPANASEWSTYYSAIPAPTSGYTCQDTGSPLVDGFATNNLVESTALGYQQAGDPLGRKSVALTVAAGRWSVAAFDVDATTSLSLWLRCMLPSSNAGTSTGIAGKDSGGGNAAAWDLRLLTAGRLFGSVSDGAASANVFSPSGYDYYDDLHHDVLLTINRTSQVITVETELHSRVSTSCAAIGSPSNGTNFEVGNHSVGAINGPLNMQVSALYVWVGYALTSAEFAEFLTER